MNAIHPLAEVDTTAPVLLREREDEIAILVLNRLNARNSLSEAMLLALTHALDEIAADINTRAVVLTANGPAFSAGHDLKELTARRNDADGGRAYFQHIMMICSAMMQKIVNLPQPVIAAVNGVASAAGCQLVASCDLAIAASDAKFATPGINIGLFCSTPMVALSRNIARKHAMEMLLTGDMVPAERAAQIGLINSVVTPGDERATAVALAKRIAAKSSRILKLGKQAFYQQIELGLAEAYAYTSTVMTENMMMRDAEEGICAFIEKRRPNWEK